MRLPKVLIGCPTYDAKEYALENYLKAIKTLDYPNADVLLVDNSDNDDYYNKLKSMDVPVIKGKRFPDPRQTVAECRNVLRQKVLDGGYDYFFSFEQDLHSPPPNALQDLVGHGKKVMTGLYYKRWKLRDEGTKKILREQPVPVFFTFDETDPAYMRIMADEKTVMELQSKHELVRVRMSGLGCCLIHRSVLEKIKFRTEPGKNFWDDTYFFNDLHSASIEAWADPSIEFKHDERQDARKAPLQS